MTNSTKLTDVTIAFSGAVQSAYLVNQLAHTGTISEKGLETAICSILTVEPKNVIDVFGAPANVMLGVKQLSMMLSKTKKVNKDKQTKQFKQSMEISRYLLSMMHLEKKLRNDPPKLEHIRQRIERMHTQVNYFSPTHTAVLDNLADLYLETLGQYNLRIKVIGRQQILSRPEHMRTIRLLLFAGIRALVLWRQVGGNRLQFLFSRRKILAITQSLMEQYLD